MGVLGVVMQKYMVIERFKAGVGTQPMKGFKGRADRSQMGFII